MIEITTRCPGGRCDVKAGCERYSNPRLHYEYAVWFIREPVLMGEKCEFFREKRSVGHGNDNEVSEGTCSTPNVAGEQGGDVGGKTS